MSSFKRRQPTPQVLQTTGTRLVSGTSSLLQISTGIPSLDDILGGGLPLGHVLTVLAPDTHSTWGELISRYFVSQGLASDQAVCLVEDDPNVFLEGCMWLPGTGRPKNELDNEVTQLEEQEGSHKDEKVKIAWRYEKMEQFRTTVDHNPSNLDDYCQAFDLTAKIPPGILRAAMSASQLILIPVSNQGHLQPLEGVLSSIAQVLGTRANGVNNTRKPLRICMNNLGGFNWGDCTPQQIIRFIISLRTLIRSKDAVVLVTFPPHLSSPAVVNGWISQIGFSSDACITLQGFSSHPSLSASFPQYSGLLTIHSTPAPTTLLPPSYRFSELRGLHTGGGTGTTAGGGENNLAFKCMRKRFVIETLHLDIEGGVSERRTIPPTGVSSVDSMLPPTPTIAQTHVYSTPSVEIIAQTQSIVTSSGERPPRAPMNKPKKSVAFKSDQPELYDF